MSGAPRALLSVYDKTGLVELARGLEALGWELVASGQTSAELERVGVAHRQVAEVTGSPEMLEGRVKTLHPRLHAGILADRSKPGHLEDLEAQGITPIDLVVCNLYPFEQEPSVEMIDIGGPAMVRAAAKNFAHVGVVVDPADYPVLLADLRAEGRLRPETRRHLSRRAFAHTAAYDAAIVAWLDGSDGTAIQESAIQEAAVQETAIQEAAVQEAAIQEAAIQEDTAGAGGLNGTEDDRSLPETLHLTLERAGTLRYGENPHQRGARYRTKGRRSWWDAVEQLGGKELSYLNLFDADAAWRLVHEMVDAGRSAGGPGGRGPAGAAVAIIKHANPCGAALGADLRAAYEGALEADPLSAFGGIVALSQPITREVAEAMGAGPQADVVVAPSFEPDALELLRSRRKATRLLAAPPPEPVERQLRTLGSSVLVQGPDPVGVDTAGWQVVTKAAPTEEQWGDLVFAWLLCARTSSNAVTVVNGGRAVGVGAGQQSRVVAAELAVMKAGSRARGGAGASDAFFPFPDGVEVLIRAGVSAVVQPGGSVRDGEVVAVADEAGICMVTTGERHFRH